MDGRVVLGHLHLAVIDPSAAGEQPMVTIDGRLALVYDGEIYNHPEVRADLERLARKFRSASDTDTEVLLPAGQEWGLAALHRFVGMYAFAVLDAVERSVAMVRDPFGRYWRLTGDRPQRRQWAALLAPAAVVVLVGRAVAERPRRSRASRCSDLSASMPLRPTQPGCWSDVWAASATAAVTLGCWVGAVAELVIRPR